MAGGCTHSFACTLFGSVSRTTRSSQLSKKHHPPNIPRNSVLGGIEAIQHSATRPISTLACAIEAQLISIGKTARARPIVLTLSSC